MRLWLLAPLFSLLCPSLVSASDYHYTIRQTWQVNRPSELTYWVSGDKRRLDRRISYGDAKKGITYGPQIAVIGDCASRQTIELDLDHQEYAIHDFRVGITAAEIKRLREQAAKTPRPAVRPAPSFTIESNTIETGERQMFFGHQARHFITTRKTIRDSQPDLVNEQVTDGWYFDFYPKTACEPSRSELERNFLTFLSPGRGRLEDYEFKRSGPELPGIPVKETVSFHQTFRTPDGSLKETTHATEIEIVDFSEAPLDPALFQVPSGFKKVERISYGPPMSFSERVQYWWWRMKYDLASLLH